MAVINVFEAGAQLGSPASRASDVRPDMGGAAAVARADAQLVNTAVQGGFALYDQIATADIMAANNAYNEKMAKLQTELMQNKEENARDNLSKYEEGREKIVGEILKNGPSTLRYGRNAMAFKNTIDRDWIGQRTQMERYQLAEMERYQDTQLNNQFRSTLKDVVINYNDEEALQGYMNRGAFMAEMRYQNYGAERIEAAQNKWNAAVVGTAVTAAVNADDYDRAGALLQGYGGMLTPEQRLSFDKVINARRKDEQELAEFEALYAEYGNDIDGALGAMNATYGTADIAKGMSYVKGEIGKHWGSNQCSNFTGSYIREAGGDVGIISSLADGTYRNAEEKGLTFTDRAQLRDGDLVFWSVDGSKYTASNNPDDVHSDSKAYKGITHVGVYDAKTGKVIQSGEHGVSVMDLDTAGYHIVGFSHIGGRGMSNVEREKQRKSYLSFVAGRESQKKARENFVVENVADQMLTAWNNGERNPEYFMDIAKKTAGNDYSMYSSLVNVAKVFGGSGNYKLTIEEQMEIEDAIENGGLSQEELVSKLKEAGCSAETVMKYVHKNKKANGPDNTEKFNWDGIMAAAKARMGGNIPAEWMPGLKLYAKRAVREYIEDPKRGNGRAPTNDWVMDVIQEGLIKGVGNVSIEGEHFWNDSTEYNMAQLANHNIYSIQNVDDNYINVYFYGSGNQPVRIPRKKFKEIMGE